MRVAKRHKRQASPSRADATTQRLKTEFVALLEKGGHSTESAAASLGKDRVTFWRWRRADEAFDAQVREALAAGDERRVVAVEESLYQRLIDGRATGVEMIFYLTNRAPDRWKHRHQLEHVGPNGGPIAVRHTIAFGNIEVQF